MAASGHILDGRGILDIFSGGGQDARVGAGREDSSTGGTLSTSSSSKTSSLGKLAATFIPIAIYVVICLILFTILRRKCKRVYAPRTFADLRAPEVPSPALPSGWFNWIVPFFKIPDTFVLNHGSLDGFFFLRFLKVLRNICLGGCLILWPVLFPVHATGGGGLGQLDMFTIGNVQNARRLYAHAFMAWVFFGFILYMVVRECIYYVNIRQAYLSSPYYAQRISSRTLLINCIPNQYLDEHRLRKLYGDSVRRVCIPRTSKALAKLVKEREQTAMRLEKAEVSLIGKANRVRTRQIKKENKKYGEETVDVEKGQSGSVDSAKDVGQEVHPATHREDLPVIETHEDVGTKDGGHGQTSRGGCIVVEIPGSSVSSELEEKEAELDEKARRVESMHVDPFDEIYYTHPYGLDPNLPDVRGSVAAQYIPVEARPYHRPIGNFGRRVDTIRWTRNRLRELNLQIFKMRRQVRRGEGTTLPAAFIEFDTQESAQAAQQTLAHHRPMQMSDRLLGIRPDEILWKGLRMPWWERIARRFFILSFIAAAVIFWSIPSAAIGLVSQISFLAKNIIFLSWLLKLPTVILNFLQGFVPALALTLWMSVVPHMLRALGAQAGIPSVTMVELFVQQGYFAFQVVQVFLVTTLTSAASAAFTDVILNPIKAKDILASNLPMASNFYLSYILIQCLMSSGTHLLQLSSLIRHQVIDKFTHLPRTRYRMYRKLRPEKWGGIFPVYANMGVIAMSYACIAPLILIFAAGGMAFMRIIWRYNIIFVLDSDMDSKGLFYPRALLHLMVGLYLAEVCLIGLFALHLAFGPMAMMIMFLIFTILVHMSLSDAIAPLLQNLPQTLALEEEIQLEEKEAAEKARQQSVARTEDEIKGANGAASSYYDTQQTFGDEEEAARRHRAEEEDALDELEEWEEEEAEGGGRSDEEGVTSSRALEGAGSIKLTLAAWFKASTATKARSVADSSGASRVLQKLRFWSGDKHGEKPPGFLARWLHPEEYEDFVYLRHQMPPDNLRNVEYPANMRYLADYAPPEMWLPRPRLWIPRDEAGVSRQEVAHTRRYTPISDRGAVMDERGRITVWFGEVPLDEPKLIL
ncbi:hypothetical protein RJ55_01713 [Drechmeria coniospora]|nr:hypothetical protein RJ55_01713 [Drechmeria coniospora]